MFTTTAPPTPKVAIALAPDSVFANYVRNRWVCIDRGAQSFASSISGLSDLAERIILAFMALLSPVQKGDIWRVRMVWSNGAVHHFGKFTSEKDAIDWIYAHPRLTKPEDTMD
jgi:hypothetical protein